MIAFPAMEYRGTEVVCQLVREESQGKQGPSMIMKINRLWFIVGWPWLGSDVNTFGLRRY